MENFYQKLSRIFRSGPAIRRRIKGVNKSNSTLTKQGGLSGGLFNSNSNGGFRATSSPFSVLGSYGALDREGRFIEFAEMEYQPEISTALDLYADEACAGDEAGKCLHIHSDNPDIQRSLEDLFYNVANINFELRRWVRNLVKYGDSFLYIEADPEQGVTNVTPLPVSDVEREEGYDQEDPYSVRFKLKNHGATKILENWQVLHLRIISNDLFLPYGSSILEPIRKVWRCLCLASGTKVLTDKGYKNIEEIGASDIVYSHNPDTKQTIKTKVKALKNMGHQQIVCVETNHRKIRVTPNHGLLVQTKEGEFIYKKAEDLICTNGKGGQSSKEADKLVLPTIEEGNNKINLEFVNISHNYFVKLIKPAEIDRVGIIQKIKKLNLKTSVKNTHAFLQGKKKISWIEYELLRINLGITTPAKYYFKHSEKESRFFNSNNHQYSFGEDFIRLFGFMLGDGWTRANSFGFAFGIDEKQNQYYVDLASKLFGNDFFINRVSTTEAQVNWSNVEAAEILHYFDFKTGFANKIIPNWVYGLNKRNRWFFLRGMFDADGCDRFGTICFANKTLIQQTQELAWTTGVQVGKTISVRPEAPNRKESYKLWLNLNKQTKEVCYEPVLRVTLEKETSDTWDLEVEHEEHNFVANGIVSHNTMMEDAMLTYRLVRSSERRVFYIDVSGVAANEVPNYMEQVEQSMRSNTSIDRISGRADQRFNPPDPLEDYFLPTKPNSQTKIDTLPAGTNTTAIEDVEYFHKKLTAGLKIPRAYLGYEEGLSSKASLSQEDIRFSRLIQSIQKILIAEMNQLAILHLFSKGFDGEDLMDFELKLSNPSTIAVMQKLNLWTMKFDVASKAKESELVDSEWIQKEILGLRMDSILKINVGLEKDKLREKTLENIEPPKPGTSFDSGDSIIDPFDPAGYDVPVVNTPNQQLGKDNKKPSLQQSVAAKPLPNNSPIMSIPVQNNGLPIKANPTPSSRTKSFSFGESFSFNSDSDFLKEITKKSLEDSLKKSGRIPNGISGGAFMKTKLIKFESMMKEKYNKNNKIIDVEILSEDTEQENTIDNILEDVLSI